MRKALAWQAIRLLIGMTVLALIALAAAVHIGFRNASDRVDDTARIAEQRRAEAYLENFAEAAGAKIKVQATWDDAIVATRGPLDTAWTDLLIGNFLWSSFEYDPLFLVDDKGNILRAWRGGKPVSLATLGPVVTQFREALPHLRASERNIGTATGTRQFGTLRWPVGVKQRPLTRWSHGFIDSNGTPAIVVMVTILPETDFSLLRSAPNRIVAIKSIDSAFLSHMGTATITGQHSLRRESPGNANMNALLLRDHSGRPLSWIAWPSAPLNEKLRERMKPLFALFLGFMILVALGGGTIIAILWRTSRELAISEAQAQHNSMHDAMTGLLNRGRFMSVLQARVALATKGGWQSGLAIAYFDIDRFKMINDTMGHHVGDELVRQVAVRLRDKLPGSDVLARLGGDEFALLRSTTGARADCESIGREIEGILKPAFEIFGNQLQVAVSCGVSQAPRNGKEAGAILRNADIAMYEAKQAGRACWRVFTNAMDASIRWRHEVETELRHAIKVGELEMAYQPVVHSESHRVSSFEALLRWNHPTKGAIGPGVFVPIAEQSGLMGALGSWVIRQVFIDSRAWPGIDISINLSPLQVTAQGFLAELRRLLRETRAKPERFIFEITEGVLLDANSQVLGVLEKVKALGFRIALDDFGTGYSSLSYLRAFKFDLIKVDRSFVQHIENDLNSQSILKAIVALGHSLKMKIVAEGVETLLQRQLVQAAGCQLIQGQYHWPALSFADATVVVEAEANQEPDVPLTRVQAA